MGNAKTTVLAFLATLALLISFLIGKASRTVEKGYPFQPVTEPERRLVEQTSSETNRFAMQRSRFDIVKATEMTAEERGEFDRGFHKKLKPAIEKWAKAYEGHVPFDPDEVKEEHFAERLWNNHYTFVFDGITLVVLDYVNDARVTYMMTRQAAKDLNSEPASGLAPDLTVPITREEVLRMVEEDTGTKFKPNEVSIRPTSPACAIRGGAYVEVGKDANNGLYRTFTGQNLSFVFDPKGKIVSYLR